MNLTCLLPRHTPWPLLIFLVLLASCTREVRLGDDIITDDGEVSFRSGQLATLEYEVDVFSRVKTSRPLTDQIDKIVAEPHSEKYKVTMSIDEYGDVIQETRSQSPSITWNVPHETLPNNIPTPTRTLYKNGKLTMYSSNGAILYQSPVDPIRAVDLANTIKDARREHGASVMNDAILRMQSQGFNGGLQRFLADARALGLTVTDMGRDVASVRVPANTPGLNPHAGDLVVVLNVDFNLPMLSCIYNADGSTALTTVWVYDGGPTHTLRMMIQEMPDVLPSGEQAVVQTTSTFSNLALTIH